MGDYTLRGMVLCIAGRIRIIIPSGIEVRLKHLNRTTPRITSVMRTNAASLLDAGSKFTISPFTIHRKSLIFDKSGCTKLCRAKYNMVLCKN